MLRRKLRLLGCKNLVLVLVNVENACDATDFHRHFGVLVEYPSGMLKNRVQMVRTKSLKIGY